MSARYRAAIGSLGPTLSLQSISSSFTESRFGNIPVPVRVQDVSENMKEECLLEGLEVGTKFAVVLAPSDGEKRDVLVFQLEAFLPFSTEGVSR
jgi:hypothetical protein